MMATLNSPLRFEPFLRPMVWGGRLLEGLGKRLPGTGPYGETWEVSDHPLAPSVVVEGPWAGATLRSLMDDHRDALLGATTYTSGSFPWLFKFLDAHNWLSVQVHPDEQAVRSLLPGEGPKNEAWFVLEARPGSRIYAGLLPGIGPTELRAALHQGTVAECLHQFEPRPGDFLYLPAGTVHAIGGGVLFAEIQQTSDATFRLFDWNRRDAQGQSRTLHVEESLACIHWDQGPVQPVSVKELAVPGGPCPPVSLVQTPYFHVDYVQETAGFRLGGQGRLQAIAVFAGQADLATGETLLPGQVWVIPAAMPATPCRPQPLVAGMLCTLP